MRYVAKVHVLDVMDEICISGYVVDADPMTDPDHEAYEFAYQVPSLGIEDPAAWLLNALYRALVSQKSPPRAAEVGTPAEGVPHTLSEAGDRAHPVMG